VAFEERPDEHFDVVWHWDDGIRVIGCTLGIFVWELDALGVLDLLKKFYVVLGAEWGLANSHFVQDCADRPQIGFGVVFLITQNFRGHV